MFGDLKQQEKTLINANNGSGSGSGPGGAGGPGGPANPGSNSSSSSVGKVFMLSLSSQPVDHEEASGRGKVRKRYPFVVQEEARKNICTTKTVGK